MPDLLLELFSEEIPARMQARAADDLARLLTEALAPLAPTGVQTFHGPRRIALAATMQDSVARQQHRRTRPAGNSAPEQALTGFLRKHGCHARAAYAGWRTLGADPRHPGHPSGRT